MARKPEATFRDSVHKHLPPKRILHRQPGGSTYASGTPDQRYSGNRAVLWIEWKYFQVIPPLFNLAEPVKKSHKVRLSALQLDWLEREFQWHPNSVGVIVGCRQGGILLTSGLWNETMSRDAFLEKLKSRKELAQAIVRRCTK